MVTCGSACIRRESSAGRLAFPGCRRNSLVRFLEGMPGRRAAAAFFRVPLLLPSMAIGAVGGWVLAALIQAKYWPDSPVAFPVACALIGAAAAFTVRRKRRGVEVTHGSARFRERSELGPLRNEEGLVVGRAPEPDKFLLRYTGPGHLVTVAPTRSGKGVGSIIPNLLLADRPALIVDPKGENFGIAARARAEFGPVFALDPFAVTGTEGVAYNPLDQLDPESDRFADDATALAGGIVTDPPGQVREAHWNGEAAALISGLILFCVSAEPPERRNLARVRTYLTLPPEEFRKLIETMQSCDYADGLVARAANRRLGQNEREAASILSTAQRHTHFLDSKRIARASERSDFQFSELAARGGSVFLVLPPDRIPAYARWLRILIVQAIGDLVRAEFRSEKSLLFLLDECAALGRLTVLERAVGLMAGYGMQIWMIFQDLHQLRSTYGDASGTFLSNAGVVQAFNVNDLETARWISGTLGSHTALYSSGGANSPGAEARTGRPLLTPDEVMNLPPDRMVVLTQEGRPIVARKVRYFADPEFSSRFDTELSRLDA